MIWQHRHVMSCSYIATTLKFFVFQAQQLLGYCPQFDALIEQMTGAETLTMFARLRGVPEKYIDESVGKIAQSLHFSEHLTKQSGQYR